LIEKVLIYRRDARKLYPDARGKRPFDPNNISIYKLKKKNTGRNHV